MAPHGGRIVVSPDAPVNILAEFPMLMSPQDSFSSFNQFPSPRKTKVPVPAVIPQTHRGGSQRPASHQQKTRGHDPDGLKSDFSCATLFSGGRVCTNNAKRSSAVIFRRPSSRAKPHTRPIFLSGPNGEDPRMCVDVHAPRRFGSGERVFAERAMQGILTTAGSSMRPPVAPGFRPASVAGYISRVSDIASSSVISSRPSTALDFVPRQGL
jgi:hypothetical protein